MRALGDFARRWPRAELAGLTSTVRNALRFTSRNAWSELYQAGSNVDRLTTEVVTYIGMLDPVLRRHRLAAGWWTSELVALRPGQPMIGNPVERTADRIDHVLGRMADAWENLAGQLRLSTTERDELAIDLATFTNEPGLGRGLLGLLDIEHQLRDIGHRLISDDPPIAPQTKQPVRGIEPGALGTAELRRRWLLRTEIGKHLPFPPAGKSTMEVFSRAIRLAEHYLGEIGYQPHHESISPATTLRGRLKHFCDRVPTWTYLGLPPSEKLPQPTTPADSAALAAAAMGVAAISLPPGEHWPSEPQAMLDDLVRTLGRLQLADVGQRRSDVGIRSDIIAALPDFEVQLLRAYLERALRGVRNMSATAPADALERAARPILTACEDYVESLAELRARAGLPFDQDAEHRTLTWIADPPDNSETLELLAAVQTSMLQDAWKDGVERFESHHTTVPAASLAQLAVLSDATDDFAAAASELDAAICHVLPAEHTTTLLDLLLPPELSDRHEFRDRIFQDRDNESPSLGTEDRPRQERRHERSPGRARLKLLFAAIAGETDSPKARARLGLDIAQHFVAMLDRTSKNDEIATAARESVQRNLKDADRCLSGTADVPHPTEEQSRVELWRKFSRQLPEDVSPATTIDHTKVTLKQLHAWLCEVPHFAPAAREHVRTALGHLTTLIASTRVAQ